MALEWVHSTFRDLQPRQCMPTKSRVIRPSTLSPAVPQMPRPCTYVLPLNRDRHETERSLCWLTIWSPQFRRFRIVQRNPDHIWPPGLRKGQIIFDRRTDFAERSTKDFVPAREARNREEPSFGRKRVQERWGIICAYHRQGGGCEPKWLCE